MAGFPRDWTVEPLSRIGDVLMCKRVLKSQTAPMGEIPFYKIGTFGKKADAYIPRELFDSFRKAYSFPKPGDILVSAAGTIGRTVIFDGADSYFQDSNIVWLGNDESSVLNSYLYWWYQVVKWTTEDGGIVARLYNGNFRATTIAYPDIPEQRRIADALDSVDKLIDNLSRRIEKKRQVKQGVMQELLTGKKRLPGFKGEWTEKSLSAIATMYSGGTPSSSESSYYGGGIPWVSIRDITAAGKYLGETEKHLTQLGLDSCPAKKFPVESILFAMYASIGKCCIAHVSVASSQAILGIYDLRGVDLEYLYQVLAFREREFAAMGQTGTQANLSKQIVERIRVLVPSLSEQCAIAAVLSDMDAEIAKLEAKRDKYIDIKQGMMNDLLTGKVRI